MFYLIRKDLRFCANDLRIFRQAVFARKTANTFCDRKVYGVPHECLDYTLLSAFADIYTGARAHSAPCRSNDVSKGN